MTCQTCNGSGQVTGDWSAELCPACSGTCEFRAHDNGADRSIPWWLIAALVVPTALYLALSWGVWSLILAAVA